MTASFQLHLFWWFENFSGQKLLLKKAFLYNNIKKMYKPGFQECRCVLLKMQLKKIKTVMYLATKHKKHPVLSLTLKLNSAGCNMVT